VEKFKDIKGARIILVSLSMDLLRRSAGTPTGKYV